MRSMVLAAIALSALGGCNKAPVLDAAGEPIKAAPTPAAKAVAMKIVDAGGVLNLDDRTLTQVADQQLQRLQSQQQDLTPDQLMAVRSSLQKNLKTALPQMKEAMQAALTEAFTKPELDLLLKLVGSKEGKAISEHMQAVTEKSYQVADAVTSNAADKAIKEMKAAWPVASPKKLPDPTAAPVGKPGDPKATAGKSADAKPTLPAKPAKPQ